MRLKWLSVALFALLVGVASRAEAGCKGSGLTWTCTAGTRPSQINSTLSSARDGATLTFEAGSYTWGGGTRITFVGTKAVTLMCATPPPSSFPWGAATSGGCDVSGSSQLIELPHTTSDKLYRVSGFNFNGSSASNYINLCPGGACALTNIRSLRLDHNTFDRSESRSTAVFFQLSDGQTPSNVEGVFDHNRFIQNMHHVLIGVFPPTPTKSPLPVTGQLGTIHNLFLEDNSFEMVGTGVGELNAGVGCTDFGGGAGVVARFNTVQNCRWLQHGVAHAYGPGNFELLFNKMDKIASSDEGTYRMIHYQGAGTGMVLFNTLDSTGFTKDGSAIAVLHYRAFQAAGGNGFCDGTSDVDGNRSPTATYRGYPCKHQPGRDWDGTFTPFYVLGNTWEDGTKVNMVVNGSGRTPDWTAQHLVENRDFYNAVSANAQTSPTSPFNGSTGMGYGTLANRPTTCTPGPEAADAGRGGVGYWATDQGEWNSTNGEKPDGQLYGCTAPNTWTLVYIPYTYPHPLVSGSSGGSSSRRGE